MLSWIESGRRRWEQCCEHIKENEILKQGWNGDNDRELDSVV